MSTFTIEDPSNNSIEGLVLVEGDVQISIPSINNGAFSNLANLPVVRRPDSVIFNLVLTEAEDVVGAEIRFRDQTSPPEWLPFSIEVTEGIHTAQDVVDLVERGNGPLERTFKSGDTIRHADAATGVVQATVTQTKV